MAQPTLEELLRIAPPMLWLDELVSRSPSSVRCRVTPRRAHPFVEEGRIEPLVCLEWMSQAAALLAALNAHDAGQPNMPRRLSAVSEARFGAEPPELDVELFIDAQQTAPASFACSVLRGDQLLASALLELRTHT
jgi:predicted hotdog family 3-hydroxylacyl-ACP dehydratase